MWDTNLSTVSQPPAHMAMPQDKQKMFFIFNNIPLVLLGVVVVYRIVSKGDVIPLLFGIGGLLCIVWEPIVDILGFCWFAGSNGQGQIVGLELFGRQIPAFMWGVYCWFVGGQAYWIYLKFSDNKLTRQGLRRLYGSLWLVNAVLEYPGILMGIYAYYGYQPFSIYGFPLWWPSINALMPIVAAFSYHSLEKHLRGFRALAIIFIVPMADGLCNASVGFPVWCALSTDLGYFVTYPAGAISMGLAFFIVWAVSLQMPEARSSPSIKAD